MSNIKTELRVQGYSVNDAGRIECRREPTLGRYNHEHVAIIRLDVPPTKAAKDFCGKVIAATDEPGALVGFGPHGAVMLFRPNGTQPVEAGSKPGHYDRTAVHPFIFEGEQAAFIASTEGQIDVSAYIWRDNRSPLTVHRSNLPLLYSDISMRAYDAVGKLLPAHAGRWGKLPTVAEIAAEVARVARLETMQQEIDAGMWTDEKIKEREEDALVASYEGVEVSQYDGLHAMQVLQARRNVARRKRLAAESAVVTTAA